MKRVLAIFLVAAMLLGLIPSGAVAFAEGSISWTIETKDGKPLQGRVTLKDDYYHVKVVLNSLKDSLEEDQALLGINAGGGSVYLTQRKDSVNEENIKISNYSFVRLYPNDFEYRFEKRFVPSYMAKGKIIVDPIVYDYKDSPKLTAITNDGIEIPIANFRANYPRNNFRTRQNWEWFVNISREQLAEALEKHGKELVSVDFTKTTADLQGYVYAFDGTKKDYSNSLDFSELKYKDYTTEYSFRIHMNDRKQLYAVDSIVFHIETTTKKSDKVAEVTFDAGDALYNGEKSQFVYKGKFAKVPNPPFKKGFLFEGWTLNGEDYNFEKTPVTTDIRLKAKFAPLPDESANFGFVFFAKVPGLQDLVQLDGFTVDKTVKEHEDLAETEVLATISRSDLAAQLLKKGIVLGTIMSADLHLPSHAPFYDYRINQRVSEDDIFENPFDDDNNSDIELLYNFTHTADYGQIEGGRVIFTLEESNFVEFNLDGGQTNDLVRFAVPHDSVIGRKIWNPTKVGHKFTHWTADGKPFDSMTDKVTKNIILNANYAKLDEKDGGRMDVVLRYVLDGATKEIDIQGNLVDYKFSNGSENAYTVQLTKEQVQALLPEAVLFQSFVKDDRTKAIILEGHYEQVGSTDAPKELKIEKAVFLADGEYKLYFEVKHDQLGQVESGKIYVDLVVEREPKEFVVRFESNDRNAYLQGPDKKHVKFIEYKVKEGQLISEFVPEPTWRGRVFTGWYVGDQKFDPAKDIVNSDTTVKARYREIEKKDGRGFDVYIKFRLKTNRLSKAFA